jgi:hypothetical protein
MSTWTAADECAACYVALPLDGRPSPNDPHHVMAPFVIDQKGPVSPGFTDVEVRHVAAKRNGVGNLGASHVVAVGHPPGSIAAVVQRRRWTTHGATASGACRCAARLSSSRPSCGRRGSRSAPDRPALRGSPRGRAGGHIVQPLARADDSRPHGPTGPGNPEDVKGAERAARPARSRLHSLAPFTNHLVGGGDNHRPGMGTSPRRLRAD